MGLLASGLFANEFINYDNLSKHSIEDLKSLIDVKKKEREKLSSKTNLPPAVKSQEKELGAQISKIERELNSRLKEKEDMNETKLTAREQRLVEMVQDAMAPIGRTDRPVKMFAPKGVEESEMSEEAVEEATVIPEYNTIEELMKSIEDGTNKVAEEYKISEMKKIAEALRAKSKKMEESEHAQHISPKVVKDILTHAKKLEAAAEKLKTALEKKSKKGKSAEPKVEKEEPVLAEGFDLRKYLIENRKK